jgi:metal-responsive CopG/Arc/MetJ family transcriptional regulator
MPTSVHLPPKLLEAVDRKAKSLRISRNQLVVQALEREVQDGEWSAGFFERLANADSETSRAVDDMMRDIRKARRSKPARRF